MIKNFKRSDIQDTPFVATKPWVLSSFQNDDLLLLEQSASIGEEIPIALEFIDYGGGDVTPFINRACNLALDPQTDDDASFEEGLKLTGIFYPDSDPRNPTGTFKRLIYSQIKNAFYNGYQNPTKIFGLENIDFQLSGIRKFLTERFRLFTISQQFFGEKMMENSIYLIDNSLDDNFVITDDGQGNIVAKKNLFSRVQEVRKFGNVVVEGDSGIDCPAAVETTTTTSTSTTSTSTTSTSTSTTSTTSTTTPPPGPTTTSTTSTTTLATSPTTTTSTSTTSTSTTTTLPPFTTTTTTSTTTLATSPTTTTSTSTTSTSTTTPAPPVVYDYPLVGAQTFQPLWDVSFGNPPYPPPTDKPAGYDFGNNPPEGLDLVVLNNWISEVERLWAIEKVRLLVEQGWTVTAEQLYWQNNQTVAQQKWFAPLFFHPSTFLIPTNTSTWRWEIWVSYTFTL